MCLTRLLHTISKLHRRNSLVPACSGTLVYSCSCSQLRYFVSSYHTSIRRNQTQEKSGNVPASDGRFFPRRAVMYVPASEDRKIKKAASLNVDTIVFDIEDGVAMSQKEVARNSCRSAVSCVRVANSNSNPYQEVVVRVNGIDSGMMGKDLQAVLDWRKDQGGTSGKPDSLMLPKCDGVEHLRQLDVALAAYHQSPRLPPILLHVIIESPRALVDLKEILSFGVQSVRHFTLSSVVFGSDDFLAAIGGTRTADAHELLLARQSIVTHARAFCLDAIDMVHINFKELESLREQSKEAVFMGFTGKQVIHPSQVSVVQQAFMPSEEQVEWAKCLTEAFKHHQDSGKGAFAYKGASIDRPLLLQAENIIKRHKLTV